MLKYEIDQTVFDSLSEAEQGFYKQDGELFRLQVEGATSKKKVDEFRQNNIDLTNQLDKFKDIDLDKVNALMEQERKLKNKELIDKKDFDGLIASETQAMKSDFEAKIANLTQQLEETQSKNNNLVSKYEIEGAAAKAFAAHKIAPDAQAAVMAQIKSKFTIHNNAVVAMDGENIELGADGNLTVDEFVGNQPEIFKVQSSGGSGNGNNNPNSQQPQAKSSRDLIAEGLKDLRG